MSAICSVPECLSDATKKGMCGKHYLRQYKNGTTDVIRKASLTSYSEEHGVVRECSMCGRTLPISEFNKKLKGHQPNCKECRKKFPSNDPVRKKETTKLWTLKNIEQVKKQRSAYYKVKMDEIREEWLEAYGRKCTCCGETNWKFLTLEHLNGDGSLHRKEVGSHLGIFQDLKKRGWPKDAYTILCYNCNLGKARNGGICPHEENAHRVAI